MTADRLFTPPAHNESAARAEQARELLSLATDDRNLSTWTSSTHCQLNYENGFDALRDALAGQGQATLAVHAELARIAAALEMIAKTPAAVELLAERVVELGNDVCEVHTAIQESGQEAAGAIREHSETVADALGNVAEVIDRVRWWQLRRRWTLRRDREAFDRYAPGDPIAELENADYPYRVELHCPGEHPDREPHISETFRALPSTACDVARDLLPTLCERAHLPAGPDDVYGQVFFLLEDGTAIGYIGAVALPGATVLLPDPPEGF